MAWRQVPLDELRTGGVKAVNCRERLLKELDEAEAKAWDSLGRYKFQMFGYWAAIWVYLNRIGDVGAWCHYC